MSKPKQVWLILIIGFAFMSYCVFWLDGLDIPLKTKILIPVAYFAVCYAFYMFGRSQGKGGR